VRIEDHKDAVLYLFCLLVTLLIFSPSQLSKGPVHVLVSTFGFAAVFFMPIQVTLRIKREVQKRLKKNLKARLWR